MFKVYSTRVSKVTLISDVSIIKMRLFSSSQSLKKKIKLIIILFLILFFITGIIDAEGSFVCIVSKSTGHLSSGFICYPTILVRHKLSLGLRIFARNYSAISFSVVPIKIYNNMDLDKFHVVYDNKGKSGVYQITNLTNNKTYIGSSVNISRRFTCYYSFRHIDRWKTSIICKALIKFGYSLRGGEFRILYSRKVHWKRTVLFG